MTGAVVLVSGGQDSTTCLFWAMREIEGPIHALTLSYNQRHWIEIERAKRICGIAGIPHRHTIANSGLGSLVTSLLHTKAPVVTDDGVPIAPVVPLRNVVFMALAAAFAASRKLGTVVIGACRADADAFPDCRVETIVAARKALSLGLGAEVNIVAPLAAMTKGATVKLARDLGPKCWEAIGVSWTCYAPEMVGPTCDKVRPCGACLACVNRRAGFDAAGEIDPGAA